MEKKFIDQLSDIERRTYIIAKNHFKESFDIMECNAFTQWLSQQRETGIVRERERERERERQREDKKEKTPRIT
jgi:hypothetical protein